MSFITLPGAGNFFGFALVATLLGMKHGFDADHMAAINAMTRYNAGRNNWLSRRAGALFSVGHGAVVICVASAVAALAHGQEVPQWLASFGPWASIFVLTYLGLLNLRSAWQTPAAASIPLTGLRTAFFGRLLKADHPAAVLSVGALFAISFDTIAQAALIGAAAARFGGPVPAFWLALLLASCFVFGMLATDGINGLWMASLVRRSDKAGFIASRTMALAVSASSLLTAAWGLANQLSPALDAGTEGEGLGPGFGFGFGFGFGLGGCIVAFVLASFILGLTWTRWNARVTQAPALQPAPPDT